MYISLWSVLKESGTTERKHDLGENRFETDIVSGFLLWNIDYQYHKVLDV